MIHSDQGAHYTSMRFIDLLKSLEIRQSMSRRGNCWDNAPQESFFGHMKDEIGKYIEIISTYDELEKEIDNYMYYYNNERYQFTTIMNVINIILPSCPQMNILNITKQEIIL